MDWVGMLFFTGLAFVCIYAGYQLFCGLPALRRAGRLGTFVLNIIPGALLALIGMGILTAEVRSLVLHKTAVLWHRPAGEGAAFHRDPAGFRLVRRLS